MDGSCKVDGVPIYETFTILGEKTGETIQGVIELACPLGALYVADFRVGDFVLRRLISLTPEQVRGLGYRVRPRGTISLRR